MNDPFEYSPKAIHHMELSIKRLRWANNPEYQHIHDALIRCRDEEGYNCGSLGCRLCRERAQASFSNSVSRGWHKKHQLYSYTIIPVDGWVAYDQIDAFDLLAFGRRHREKLKRVLPNGMRIAGGVDFSLNIFENGERSWQVHLHFLTDHQIEKKTEKALKLRYPKDDTKEIFRPLRIETIASSDVRSNSKYSLKSYFLKRSGFIADPEKGGSGDRTGKGQGLPADADELLQLALSKYRVTDALFLIGLKRKRTSDPAEIKLHRTGNANPSTSKLRGYGARTKVCSRRKRKSRR
ncbi:MAG: hypothetical protein JXR00_04660 [Sulfitobacter geojensis]